MKRTVKVFVFMAIIVIAAAFTGVAALASDYDSQADALNEMGLFCGTDTGYELERIPTRGEAAVMLVRLLGKENEAKAGAYEIPFTDVPDWAKQHVGYLYVNNLAKGSTPTTYNSGDTCNAQMFATFLLRALGYNDSIGDFTYSEALEYAASIGLIEAAGTTNDFKRDDMVAFSYSALFQPVKDGGGTTLLEKLVAEHAVVAAAADKYMASYQNYLNVMNACTAYAEATRVHQSSDTEIQLTIDGQQQALSQQADIAAILDGNDIKFRMDSTLTLFGVTQEMGIYYADGWTYLNLAGMKIKSQSTLDMDELTEMNQQLDIGEAIDPFYLIESISRTQAGADVIYTVTYLLPDFNELLDSLLAQALDDSEVASFQVNNMQTVYTCDSGGSLKSVLFTGDFEIAVSNGQESQTAVMVFRSETKILATGNAVTVTPPADLTSYTELKDSLLVG